ncbi:probable inactive leucine-rich repeat receptor-like protein kinase, partial [Tanacetum coccineum]
MYIDEYKVLYTFTCFDLSKVDSFICGGTTPSGNRKNWDETPGATEPKEKSFTKNKSDLQAILKSQDNGQSYFSQSKEPNRARMSNPEKVDVYDFGIILLEILVGKPLYTQKEVEYVKEQFQTRMTHDDASIKNVIQFMFAAQVQDDPAERPSVEDMLWNLQFAAPVQDAWHSSEVSHVSYSQPANIHNLQSDKRLAICGACKFLRRRCVNGCIFAPYFSPDHGAGMFAAVHKVFGQCSEAIDATFSGVSRRCSSNHI